MDTSKIPQHKRMAMGEKINKPIQKKSGSPKK